MANGRHGRRQFLALSSGAMAVSAGWLARAEPAEGTTGKEQPGAGKRGDQRLSLDALKAWEALGYGIFIHFGMSTFVANELPDGKAPATMYAPDHLDVDQWISVAREAGMKYAVLTTKHVAGHCLWPSQHTDYTVAHSGDTTDVVRAFVDACAKHGIRPGFYYCSWDNHNRFGSVTPSDASRDVAPYTTSVYQTFQTAQITELLTKYGPIAEMWIDIPGVLGRGYRTFLYEHVARLQPETVVMMNSGISTQETYNVDYAWPSDIIAIERQLPPEGGHRAWRTVEGREYYMPGEVCDPIGKEWFYVEGDGPRPDDVLAAQLDACRARGVNLLLDVPPDRHGLIPQYHVEALQRLRKKVGI